MKRGYQEFLAKAAVLTLAGVASIALYAAEAPPRPGLFWNEAWHMQTAGEHEVTQGDVSNPALELKTYGLKGEEGLMINGVEGSDANPPHTWRARSSSSLSVPMTTP